METVQAELEDKKKSIDESPQINDESSATESKEDENSVELKLEILEVKVDVEPLQRELDDEKISTDESPQINDESSASESEEDTVELDSDDESNPADESSQSNEPAKSPSDDTSESEEVKSPKKLKLDVPSLDSAYVSSSSTVVRTSDKIVPCNKGTISSKVTQSKCSLGQCTLDHKGKVVLRPCLHTFFRACLAKAILAVRDPTIRCPFKLGNLVCKTILQEAEIKQILSPAEYDEYLTISLLIAERRSPNSYHCKTPNCLGWCTYENRATAFQCPVCTKTNCLLCKTIHLTRPCKQLEDLLNYPDENNTASLAKIRGKEFIGQKGGIWFCRNGWKALTVGVGRGKMGVRIAGPEKIYLTVWNRTKNNARKLYPKLLDLYRVELVLFPDDFTCPICFDDFLPMEGIILKSCLHTFCRNCLQQTIILCETAEVKCPYKDDNYACDSEILEYEIKALLSPEIYEERLAKTFTIAETKIDNAFHCKTPDCRGWCIVEDAANQFYCPVCRRSNCTICGVIHEGRTCEQYQGQIHDDCRLGFERSKSESQLQGMIDRGEAMKCPKCQALITKIAGCDGMTCPMCKLDICWVTKRPRWGPKGKGDWSGGCQCNYNGRKCHPACSNCH